MLSKIGGRLLGVSKKVQSVIARIPDIATTVDMLDAITWVIDDWKKSRDRQSVKVAIINISYSNYVGPHFKTPDPVGLAVYLRFQDLLNYAIEQGLLPICSAGNKPGVCDLSYRGIRQFLIAQEAIRRFPSYVCRS